MIVSLSLVFVDFHFKQLNPVREGLSSLLTPIQWLIDLPSDIVDWGGDVFTSRDELIDEIDDLRTKNLLLQRKAQKLQSVSAELNRLRALLNASRILDEGVVVTELIGVSPDSDNQYITIDKGKSDNVYPGQAVLDAFGLMGQVIEVSEFTSRVLLVSDARHAVPVQVNRNGVRAVAYGIGSLNRMILANVPDTADIVVGDMLVSSGLGGRFPAGYPVATVESVVHDPGKPFATVKIAPKAELNKSRLLLLVFQQGIDTTPKSSPSGLSGGRE